MKLNDDTYEFIKQEAVDLLIRHDVQCIPISGFELAKKIGIFLIPYSSLNHKKQMVVCRISPDGFYLEPGDGTERIYYNDQSNYNRLNMTLLHEIGHCILGHNEDTDPDVAEAEANFFAKYIAAPPPLVHKINPHCPDDIQRLFFISHEASCYAYNYYLKWLRQRKNNYTNYEISMLKQFSIAI